MKLKLTALVLATGMAAGCGSYEPAAARPDQSGEQPGDATTEPAAGSAATPATVPEAAPGTAPRAVPPPAPPVAQAPNTVVRKAEVGVGRQGRGYGRGLVATPAAAYFAARGRITFDIQIVKAMQLYQTNKGQAPKTHEEFMEEIIKKGLIRLPDLPAGERYVYHPDKVQLPKHTGLMVERQR